MKNTMRRFSSILSAAACAAFLAGCGPSGSTAETASTEGSAAAETEAIAAGPFTIGQKLPDFELATYDGETLRLGDLLDGEHYVAVMWHSPACPCANNCLSAVSRELATEEYSDLRMVGVVSDKQWNVGWFKDDLNSQVESGMLPFPIVVDRDQSLMQQWGVARTPTVFLTDKEGNLRFWGAPENVLDPGAEPGTYRFLMKEALDDLKADRPVAEPTFMPIGCLISTEEV